MIYLVFFVYWFYCNLNMMHKIHFEDTTTWPFCHCMDDCSVRVFQQWYIRFLQYTYVVYSVLRWRRAMSCVAHYHIVQRSRPDCCCTPVDRSIVVLYSFARLMVVAGYNWHIERVRCRLQSCCVTWMHSWSVGSACPSPIHIYPPTIILLERCG